MRNKTVNALNSKAAELGIAPEELMTKVRDFIDNFCGMEEKEAKKLMIQLKVTPARPIESEASEGEGTPETKETEKPSFIPKYLEDLLEENGIEDIGVENVGKVLGDAAAFYKEAHPDCWLAGDKDEYPEELRKAVGDDITLLSIIYEQCKSASYLGDEAVGRIKHLTSSSKENYRFGGLREMKFSTGMAQYFKDIANQIGEYFKTFLPEPMNRIEIPTDFIPSPEAEVTQAKAPQKETPQKETPQEETPQEKGKDAKPEKLDVQQILEHGKSISSFLHFHKKMLEAGLNPDLIIQKSTHIKSLLKAAKEL